MEKRDQLACCPDCIAINRLWPLMQRALAALQHRPPNEETVSLAVAALEEAFSEGGAD